MRGWYNMNGNNKKQIISVLKDIEDKGRTSLIDEYLITINNQKEICIRAYDSLTIYIRKPMSLFKYLFTKTEETYCGFIEMNEDGTGVVINLDTTDPSSDNERILFDLKHRINCALFNKNHVRRYI
jgi:hypothetical protein